MSEETRAVEPAMTAREWADVLDDASWWEELTRAAALDIGACFTSRMDTPRRHALAALCLHGQPYGFSWEDVDFLLGVALDAEASDNRGLDADPARELATRIAALLPPRP